MVDLARRFKLQSEDDGRASAGSGPLIEGEPTQFWVNRPGGYVLVDGVVKAASDNAYWVFDARVEVDPADLQAAIDEFESHVWPTVTWPVWRHQVSRYRRRSAAGHLSHQPPAGDSGLLLKYGRLPRRHPALQQRTGIDLHLDRRTHRWFAFVHVGVDA